MYKYFNQFHMTHELETVLTKIISKKEGGDYVCKIVTATIPEHKEEVYGYTGSVAGLSGADIAFRNEHYGRFYKIKVPTLEYEYIVVMEKIAYQYFKKSSFNDIEDVKNALKLLSIVFAYYDGIFNSQIFYEKFPYLEDFFSTIDKWRAETDRVTIDDDVLQQSYKKTLKKARTK